MAISMLPPALLIYTDRVLGPRSGGDTRTFVVFIRPKYREDAGIREHELTHVWQWWLACAVGLCFGLVAAAHLGHVLPWWSWLACSTSAGGAMHPLLYRTVRRYRMWAEVQAYGEQMRHPDRNGERLTLDRAAAALADEELYHLGITIDQAREALKGDRTLARG